MFGKNTIIINSEVDLEGFMSQYDPVILYFGLKDWVVCDDVFPLLLDITDNSNVKIAKIDIGEQKRIAGQHLVFTVPTISIFYEGKEVLRESRFIDFNNIKRLLENIS